MYDIKGVQDGKFVFDSSDYSLASPLLSDALSGEFQKIDPYTQLTKLNADCMDWLDGHFGPAQN